MTILAVLAAAAPLGTAMMVKDQGGASAVEAAQDLYGTTDLAVYEATDGAFDAAFPSYTLYAVRELARHPAPTHAMALASDGAAFDVTEDFSALLVDAGVVLSDADDALRVAKAYAQTANTELQRTREVVDASDADALGVAVSDPQAASVTGGWQVRLTTWSATNGVLADWTIDFSLTGLESAEWTVTHLRAGDFERSLEAPDLRVGTTLANTYDGGHALTAHRDGVALTLADGLDGLAWTPAAEATTFDGATARVLAAEGETVDAGLAQALADAVAWAYGWQVEESTGAGPCAGVANPDASNWTLTSRDPDCVLEVRVLPVDSLLCGACVLAGDDAVIYVAHDLEDYAEEALDWYRNPTLYGAADLARTVVGHAHLVALASPTPGALPDAEPRADHHGWARDGARLDPEHFSVRVVHDDAYQAILDHLKDSEGFVHVGPATDGSATLQAIFTGPAPADTGVHLLPSEWDLRVYENVTADDPVAYPHELHVEIVNASALPDGAKIQSGTLLIVNGDPGDGVLDEEGMHDLIYEGDRGFVKAPFNVSSCTANFVWEDANGTVYLGTAAHCFSSGNILACVMDCQMGHALNAEGNHTCESLLGESTPCPAVNGTFVDLGAPAFASYREESDFAVLEVPRELRSYVVPDVKAWGGPTQQPTRCEDTGLLTVLPEDVANTAPVVPRPILHYGYGTGAGETPATHARAGFAYLCLDESQLLTPAGYFMAVWASYKGDSGSPVLLPTLPGGAIAETTAYGHLTRIRSGVPAEYALDQALTDGGLDLRVGLAGESWS